MNVSDAIEDLSRYGRYWFSNVRTAAEEFRQEVERRAGRPVQMSSFQPFDEFVLWFVDDDERSDPGVLEEISKQRFLEAEHGKTTSQRTK